ncbi:uncharacterized protein LOC132032135 [Lycium ferocissimum]|uniref:uncharacterized protein LOC132032135 n=1 Tax=Lycium ferocissimum TaxID=112874 RepID=UPI0028156731|nr:uncharacterized protein LOC132032135 [Lycium ferocissimum]
MSGVADGLSWSQPTGHVAVPSYFWPQGQTEPHARQSQSPITPLTIPHGLPEFYHVSQRAARSGTPTVTPSPTVSQPSTSSTPHDGTSEREESSFDSDEERPKKGDPPQVLNFDMNGRLIIEPVGYTFYPGKATKNISKMIKGLYRGAVPS